MKNSTIFEPNFDWDTFLFSKKFAIPHSDLEDSLKKISHEFSAPDSSQYIEIKNKYDNWFFSEGQDILCALLDAIWPVLWSRKEIAMPAHDARHALFKVPGRAIEHFLAEKCSGIDSLGLLGALLHDWGRWAEEQIYHGPQPGPVHSRLSFVLLRSFIERNFKKDFPEDIKNLLLESVIKHTKGANADDNMPLKLVVRSDRDQLYGPEFVIRIIHHVPGFQNKLLSFYGEDSVFSTINRTNVTRLQGPLHALDHELKILENFSESFLLQVARPEDLSKVGVYPEKTLSLISFKEQKNKAHALAFNQGIQLSLEDAITELLDSKNLAKSEKFTEDTFKKFEDVPLDMRQYVQGALNITLFMRKELDKMLLNSLRDSEKFGSNRIVLNLAQKLLAVA